MPEDIFLIVIILVVISVTLLNWLNRPKKSKAVHVREISSPQTLKRREINPLQVSRELLEQLLYCESEEQNQQLLEAHPELVPFENVGIPMHEALGLFFMPLQFGGEPDPGEHIIMISEFKPGISSVTTQTSDGKRIANLFDLPADTLAEMMLVTPEALQLYIPKTLQTALHHPEYLTEECYWMMDIMLASPKTGEEIKPELARLHKALGLCLEYGLDETWICDLQQKLQTNMN